MVASRKLCLFALCETSWQQTMGGQRCCKHAMEMGGRMSLDEYKKWSLTAKKDMYFFVAVCVEGVCKNM